MKYQGPLLYKEKSSSYKCDFILKQLTFVLTFLSALRDLFLVVEYLLKIKGKLLMLRSMNNK